MLSKNAQKTLDGWISAAGPVVEKVYGTSEASWPEVRAHYMQGLEKKSSCDRRGLLQNKHVRQYARDDQ